MRVHNELTSGPQGRREEAQSPHSWARVKITFSFLHSCSSNSCLWHVGSIVWSVAGVCNFLSQGHRWLCQCTRKTTAFGPLSSHQTPRSPSHIQITLCYFCVFNSPHSYEIWSAITPRKSTNTLSTNLKPYLIKNFWWVGEIFSKEKKCEISFLSMVDLLRGRNLYWAMYPPQIKALMTLLSVIVTLVRLSRIAQLSTPFITTPCLVPLQVIGKIEKSDEKIYSMWQSF